MATSFDTQVHSDELIPCCPYCDQPLDIGGPIQDGMHAECYTRFGEELEEAFPTPIEFAIEPAIEIQPVGEAELMIEIDRLLARS